MNLPPGPSPESLFAALAGRYEMVRELGRGGMSTVYLARDVRHDRLVALKTLRPDLALGAERFLLEIKVAAGLRHPHIVPLYESGEARDVLYYVMPYIAGDSLDTRLRRDKRLPLRDALVYAAEIAEALDYAHRHGVVHRDIKPSNVLLDEGHAAVTDFGVARAVAAAGDTRITHTGTVVGTPAYMSPEQIAGEQQIDGRSDIYSLGCVLYETVTGQAAFPGNNPVAVMSARFSTPAPRVSGVLPDAPSDIDQIVERALAIDASKRFSTAGELAQILRDLATTPTRATPRVAAAQPAPAIAVLPFTNMSGEKDNEFFADGMTEEIINALAQLDGLRVASRTSAFAFKGKDVDIRQIGDQLRVANVLEGSVRRSSNRVRVTAQLISVSDGYHLWSERYDRELDDIFKIQDEITHAIVETLKVKLGRVPNAQLVKARTSNLEAYNAFLEGRFHWNRRGQGLLQARESFERAIALAPDFADAYSGLADCWNLIGWYQMGAPHDVFPRAKAAAHRALELDATLAEAHCSLAFAHMAYDWDFEQSDQRFRRALELNRGYATAHHWYAELLMAMGRTDQAITEARTALELDPLGLIIHTVVAMAHYFARDYAGCVEHCEQTLAMDRNFTPVMIWLGRAHLALDEPAKAIATFEKARSLSGNVPSALEALAHARAGQREMAESMLERFEAQADHQYVSAFDLMLLEETLGNRERAMVQLAAALQSRGVHLAWTRVDPLRDSLRGEPAFQDMVEKIGRAVT